MIKNWGGKEEKNIFIFPISRTLQRHDFDQQNIEEERKGGLMYLSVCVQIIYARHSKSWIMSL